MEFGQGRRSTPPHGWTNSGGCSHALSGEGSNGVHIAEPRRHGRPESSLTASWKVRTLKRLHKPQSGTPRSLKRTTGDVPRKPGSTGLLKGRRDPWDGTTA